MKLEIVGHRGSMQTHPENTLAGFQHALSHGIPWVELDIQITRDGVPVILHDDNLLRTAGIDRNVFDMDYHEVANTSVHYPDQFGAQFQPTSLPRLADLVGLAQQFPHARFMVEIKDEAITHFGVDKLADLCQQALAAIAHQVVFISYNPLVLQRLRNFPVGWVLTRHDEQTLEQARLLNPDYLICNYRKIVDPASGLWPGNWQWMLYDISDFSLARKWFDLGVHMIESGDPVGLLKQWKKHHGL